MTEPSRICPECGVVHGWQIEDSRTGKVIELLDKCRGCLLGFGPEGRLRNGMFTGKEQVTING